MTVFFTADTHFGHYNIMRYIDRPFKSVDEMNNTIITNWNKVVSKSDRVYHLGDFGFHSYYHNIQEIFNELKGHK